MSDYRPGSPPADIGAALSYGWDRFQRYAGQCIAIVLIPIAAQLAFIVFGQVVLRSWPGVLLCSVLASVAGLVLSIGSVNLGLMVTRGEAPDIARAFHCRNWGAWAAFAFVYGLMIGVGSVFCVVGALFVIAFFGLAPYYFVDGGMHLGEALTTSLDTTRRVSGLALALGALAFIGYAGAFVLLVGMVVTMPIAQLGAAFLYRQATGAEVL